MQSGIQAALLSAAKQYMLPNYRPFPLVIEKGHGATLIDADGKEYIDLVAGIAVASLGHGNQELSEVISSQSQKILHSSNIMLNKPEIELARMLCELSGLQRVFFCNSGAEANEAMIKLARRVYSVEDPERFEIICMSKAFHGRTLGTISATGQEKYREGFGPLLPGFKVVPFRDIDAIKQAVNKKTAAILLEPILGEGGVIVPPSGYLKEVRSICDQTGALMLLDEVQVGVGRTGLLFAFQHEGVVPDAIALAKGLGGGLPIGAMLVREPFANVLNFPTHGSTFGGNAVACAAAGYVLRTVGTPAFLEHVRMLGAKLSSSLHVFLRKYPHIIGEVRGRGLFYGLQFTTDPGDFKERALAKGLIVNFCGDRVMRIAPPLVITERELEKALSIMEELMQ